MVEIRIINLADLVDNTDPQKRTYRQINAAKQHAIPLYTLVELENRVRLYVVAHTRDCDQTPLYSLAADLEEDREDKFYREWKRHHGYAEEDLTVLDIADT